MFVLHKFLIFRNSVGDKYSKTIKCIELNRSLYQLRLFFRTTAFTNNCAQIENATTTLDLMLCSSLNTQTWILGRNPIFCKVIDTSNKCDFYEIFSLNICDGMLTPAARLRCQFYEAEGFEWCEHNIRSREHCKWSLYFFLYFPKATNRWCYFLL